MNICKDHKPKEFCYKLIHRIVAIYKELDIYGIESNDNCYYCGNPDSIIHTFEECHFSKTFFNQVLDYFNRVNGVALKPLASEWLFGLQLINDHHTTNLIKKFNYFVLFAKRYPYTQKLDKKNSTLDDFIPRIACRLKLEKSMTVKHQNEEMLHLSKVDIY